MKLKFSKYQGTGNDFVMIDNRTIRLPADDAPMIRRLCDRRFGIGGDGLIYLQDRDGYDFEMVYFNSDGRESTMCGNGGRCIVQFAHALGLGGPEYHFLAIDGPHTGRIMDDGTISLQMQDVLTTFRHGDDYILDTGSPHLVRLVNNVKDYPVAATGRQIRYSDTYRESGINVNFVEPVPDGSIFVRTYERGVEDETLSCGTGVVASAIAFYYHNIYKPDSINIQTLGGSLQVKFDVQDMHFTNVWLTGPAVEVYSGETTI
jgi:diaminopimelate epimerase